MLYVKNKAGLTGQSVPGRRIPGHWPYPGPEELAEAELVGPDGWTFLSLAKVVLILECGSKGNPGSPRDAGLGPRPINRGQHGDFEN